MNWTAFLESRGAIFAPPGHVRNFGSDDHDAPANSMTDLSHLGLLDIRGEDAADYLHRQFTLNVLKLVELRGMMTAWCNPKGRVLATFILYHMPDHYALLLPADQVDSIGKRLKMYVLRANVMISDLGSSQPRIGVSGHEAIDKLGQQFGKLPLDDWQLTLNDNITALRLPGTQPRLLLTGPTAELAGLWQSLESLCRPVGTNQWILADIEAGLPWINTATSGEFLPQMLDLEHIGGLVYDKGCYPGQEVIARLHFRGEVKQRLQRGETDSEPPSAGTPVYAMDKQRAGTVIYSAATATGSKMLAVATPGQDTLHIATPAGRLLKLETESLW